MPVLRLDLRANLVCAFRRFFIWDNAQRERKNANYRLRGVSASYPVGYGFCALRYAIR